MMYITFSILLILASIEASLAYMRDLLAQDREALHQTLAGASAVNAEFRWIPSVGQMVMGFMLPFALAFVAIPLESFIHSARTVLGVASVAVLRAVVIVLRLLGGMANQLSKILVYLYDIVITVPLGIETLVRRGVGSRTSTSPEQRVTPDPSETEHAGQGDAIYADAKTDAKSPAKKSRKPRRGVALTNS
jgi:hypothetical protein